MTSSPPPVAVEDGGLQARLDQLDLVLTKGAGQLDHRTAEAGQRLLLRAGQRLRLAGDHTVVALAGGTGSGKSTMFNALAGLELSGTGTRRPTTQVPCACVWGDDLAPELLEWLEVPVERRISRRSALDADAQTPLAGLVLLDLPDHDSIEVTHRLEVDRLIELVDLLVWVLDPQKYADDSVHEQYLRPLHPYAGLMIVVLNQADRLDPGQAEACLQDLRRMLTDDGLDGVRLLSASALTGLGVSDLRDLLAGAVESRQAKVRRVSADLDALSPRLRTAARPVVDVAVDALADAAAAALAEAAGVDRISSAVQARALARGRRRVGWLLWSWRTAPAPDVAAASVPRAAIAQVARTTGATVTAGMGEPWRTQIGRRASATSDSLADGVDVAVRALAEPVPDPSWWTVMAIVQWCLLVVGVVGAAVAFTGSALVGSAVTGAALLAGWACAAACTRAVIAAAAGRRAAVDSRLRADLARLTDDGLIAVLHDGIGGYNAVQQALHKFG